MKRMQLLVLGVLSFICLASAVVAAPPAEDTPSATPGGTTFTIPAGWTQSARGQFVVLTPPEPDLEFALIDLEAKDAAAAVAAGWAAFDPAFKRPLRIATPAAARSGWEAREFFDYEVSPNEKLGVSALAYRAGGHWLVGLIRGGQATLEKRGGPMNLALASLRPKGYQRESFAGRTAHALDAPKIKALKEFVANGMKQLGVPGVAFSLIDGGKIVYEGGIGVRQLGERAPIGKDTLFIAASNTKALATLLLAKLVDEQKLRWDEPVTEAYPSFKLGDAETTRQVQIKHLICACTGMPRQDLEWLLEYEHATPASAIEVLASMQPTSRFGEVFQYSNLMAAAAGFIGGSIAVPGKETGAAFDDAMQRHVFGPLGMTRSTFDFAKAMQGDYARPHDVNIDGKTVLGQMALNYSVVPVRPAGGVWTSAHDLSQYVIMELARGKLPDGTVLVSERNLLERRVPNVVLSEDINYGMGLMVDKRWGVTVIRHGGDLAGYHSDMMWFPESKVGAVILTNGDSGGALRGPFLRKLAELIFDGKPEADAQLKATVKAINEERRTARKRLVLPADPAAAGRLAARYESDALGGIRVTRKGKDVVLDIGEWKSVVASRKNDDGSVSFITTSPNLQGFEFVVGERDGKRTLILRDAQHEYVFRELS